MIETVFPQLNAQILHKFPCWRAAPAVLRDAPAVLRDAQVSVTPFQLEFLYWRAAPTVLRDAQLPEDLLQLPDSTARRAKPGCATRNCQR
ncbi:hypothetical protein A2U01_0070992 [Trifolium medium]|uniref:Uncharacterized protein n=1 Tax=Trifolium medium TaxID=97028 RepID=A0A392SLI1_9FABA|nr:hypothetical protein [Trifolium medium]